MLFYITGGYNTISNKLCVPDGEELNTFEDAKNRCNTNPGCRMFYKTPYNSFIVCPDESTWRSFNGCTLYWKVTNNRGNLY